MAMKPRPRTEQDMFLDDAWDDLRDAALEQPAPTRRLRDALNVVLRLTRHPLAVPLSRGER